MRFDFNQFTTLKFSIKMFSHICISVNLSLLWRCSTIYLGTFVLTKTLHVDYCILETDEFHAFIRLYWLIKLKMHRIPVGTIKICTIIRDIDRWFVCLSTISKVVNSWIANDSIIGFDVSLLNWITLSNDDVIDRPRFLKQSI